MGFNHEFMDLMGFNHEFMDLMGFNHEFMDLMGFNHDFHGDLPLMVDLPMSLSGWWWLEPWNSMTFSW